DKETGMIKNLMTDLNAAELSVAVAQLGASGSITRLSSAHRAGWNRRNVVRM
ncbi:MAG: DUF6261 family protein, partial [Segatella oris]|uniref:DUF6261 family protein n=1 Tax=Segatella oris TaxID=28135 RepID=UPI003FA33114